MGSRQIISVAFAALLVLVAVIIAFGSWFTIDQGQRGVLLTNGAYTETVGPGLHFKAPWFQSVVKISTQQQVVYWTCETNPDGSAKRTCRSDERGEMLAVEARMTAQVEVQKQEQTLQQEKIKADIAVTQAEGRAKSVKAEADAKAYATQVQGTAEADAIKARAAALSNNPLLVELTKAEKWNGTLPTSMIPGSSVPFLSVQ
ncbi:exported hypothetical protein [Mesorhizobium plurifarium]|uniref:Band 7 domain-containing protein n=1 Tax=Mesorhizobium plurifarium TaxID=69974 RepID=A0A090G7C8_MESPL|nr:exported hypothetical protein [Mesorhizobium plurifarium]